MGVGVVYDADVVVVAGGVSVRAYPQVSALAVGEIGTPGRRPRGSCTMCSGGKERSSDKETGVNSRMEPSNAMERR